MLGFAPLSSGPLGSDGQTDSADVTATASLPVLSLVAPAASASVPGVGVVTATAALPVLVLVAPVASATAGAALVTATAALPQMGLIAPTVMVSLSGGSGEHWVFRANSRTLKVKVPGSKGGRGMHRLVGGRPTLWVDRDSDLDYSIDWTDWLAQDAESAAMFEIIGSAGVELHDKQGNAFAASVFARLVSPSALESITFRIRTTSSPPRVEDRTVYLAVTDR